MPANKAMWANASFSFSGQHALVTGGSRGIGKAVVQALIASGAAVSYIARTPMEEKISARHFAVDIRDERQVGRFFSELDKLSSVDMLINVAAINHCHGIEDILVHEWDNVLSVNLRGTFLITRGVALRMKKKKSGKIVNVSSIAGRHRSPVSGVHYVASKAGIIGFTRQLAYELGPHGINVNAVCPSQTRTAMLDESMSEAAQEELAAGIPLRRIATVEEQVGPILFLCSDAASYMTGAVLDVNGGQI